MRAHPYKLYGALLLAVVVGAVTLSILEFQQAFTPFTHVRVHIARAGLQLLPGSDVKVRGLIVGSVQDITSTGNGADIDLRLNPAKARTLPDNVTVRMVPKTLFGEKYVDLRLPTQPAAAHLHDGSVIGEDHTKPALEIDQALNDLLPMLRAVPPVQLDHTLTSLATALDGNGRSVGDTIVRLQHYLHRFNPQLPTLAHDMRALTGVTRTYRAAAGPLLHTLGNLTVTGNTIVDDRQQLSRFLDDVTTASNETRDLVARTGYDVIRLNRLSRPVLALLARYSPEFPCFVKGYAGLVPRIHHAVPSTPGLNHAAHVVVEVVPSYPTYSNPIDLPQFRDKRGPHCYGLPHPPMALPVIHYKDGTQDDPRFRTQGTVGGHPPGGSTKPARTATTPTALQRLLTAPIVHALAAAYPTDGRS